MHGAMGGWYEIRRTGPGREQFRLFCRLENGASGELARRGLQRVRDLGSEHERNYPRRIAT